MKAQVLGRNKEMKLGKKKKQMDATPEVTTVSVPVGSPVMQAPKKKMKPGKVIGIAVAVTVVGIVVLSNVVKAITPEPLQMVEVATAEIRDLEETIDTSGFIESSQEKTYFSPVNAVINECNVTKGSYVEAGALLVSYDITDLETAAKQAELTDKAAQNGYASTLKAGSDSEAKLADSTENVTKYEDLVAKAEEDVKYLNNKIAEFNRELSQITQSLDATNPDAAALKRKGELEDAILVHQQRLTNMQSDLTKYSTELAEYEGIKSGAEAGKLNSETKAQIEAEKELSTFTKEMAQKDLETAKAGVTSEFKGIATDVQAVKGAMAAEGTALFTIADISSVKVSVNVSKNDLERLAEGQSAEVTIAGQEYPGTVSRINRQATTNQSGTPVITAEITVNETDDNIYLGIEAAVVIHTASATDAVTIPAQALNTGKDGEFCYVVVDGFVEKRDVIIGVNDGEYIEILEGVEEGEDVITVVNSEIEDGMEVSTMYGDEDDELEDESEEVSEDETEEEDGTEEEYDEETDDEEVAEEEYDEETDDEEILEEESEGESDEEEVVEEESSEEVDSEETAE